MTKNIRQQPSAQEQEMIELINRMRQNPKSEYNLLVNSSDPDVNSAMRYFDVDTKVLKQQWNSLKSVAPLAWSPQLYEAASDHNKYMIKTDQQTHNGWSDRIKSSGYDVQSMGQNVYAWSESVFYGHAGFSIDWGFTPTGIQKGAGHRQAIMNGAYREVGVAITEENNSKTSVGPMIITQNFGNRKDFGDPWLLGVVYDDDKVDDDFYTAGEGLGGVKITAQGQNGTFETISWNSGGYQMQLDQGTYVLTFSDPRNRFPDYSQNIKIGSENLKQDLAIDDMPAGIKTSNLSLSQRTENKNPPLASQIRNNFSNDLIPNISINDISLKEGNGSRKNAQFVITLDQRVNKPVTVDYQSQNRTARVNQDFLMTKGTLTFKPNQRRLKVSVPVFGDLNYESNESFVVKLSKAKNAKLGDAIGTATILNDDKKHQSRTINASAAVTYHQGNNNKKGNNTGTNNKDFLLGTNRRDVLLGLNGNDKIDGGRGNDIIIGGLGRDEVTGGPGRDKFQFNSFTEGVDTITDFSSRQDQIIINSAGFSRNLTKGRLNPDQFSLGSRPSDLDDRFIYNENKGLLFFDANGINPKGSTLLARLPQNTDLTNQDIIII